MCFFVVVENLKNVENVISRIFESSSVFIANKLLDDKSFFFWVASVKKKVEIDYVFHASYLMYLLDV